MYSAIIRRGSGFVCCRQRRKHCFQTCWTAEGVIAKSLLSPSVVRIGLTLHTVSLIFLILEEAHLLEGIMK